MINKSIRDYIKEQYYSLWEISNQERNKIIKQKVKEKFKITLESPQIYQIIKQLEKKVDLIKENISEVKDSITRMNELFTDELPETKKVKWETYVILRIKVTESVTGEDYFEPIPFKLSTIDAIYKDYAHHGHNLTGQNIMDKYWLSWKAWWVLKNQLNLNKWSNVVSDITLNSLWEEELDWTIDEMTSDHISNKYKQKLKKAHEAKVKSALQVVSSNQAFLEFVQKYIDNHKPLEIDFKIEPPKNYESKQYNLSDLHIGKIWTKKIIERLDYILHDIIKSEEDLIYINCFGDLAETLTQDWMHPWQLAYGTEQEWWYGFDLMMNIVVILEKFLLAIKKAGKMVYFTGIPWNHDRMTQAKDMDVQKTWWLVIYEMIKRGLSKSEIEIQYLRDTISIMDIGNIHYIIAHGDGSFDKLSPEKILVLYWDLTRYNIIFSWDKHHLNFKEYPKCIWFKTTWLWWQGLYDKTNWYRSEPWYVIIQENQFKTADMQIKRLQNDF